MAEQEYNVMKPMVGIMMIGMMATLIIPLTAGAAEPEPPAPEPTPPLEPPPEAKTTLYGLVADQETGEALEGASVTLDTIYSSVTDSDGRYEITDVEPGNYTLRFEKSGYNSASVDVSFPEGTIRIDATLVLELPTTTPSEFYMAAEMVKSLYPTIEPYTVCEVSLDIINRGKTDGVQVVHVYDSAGALDAYITVALAPGETYTWARTQWVDFSRIASYTVWAEGDWVGNNRSVATFP